ncbi:hypothetical protein RJT34_23867 [Clitoria ternatea]|uniref:Uncharacterized protein n=1 Tax=Clitoria ternatea TaxID=43366 RepID=A0AAN9IHJ5_CLITE
MVYASSIKERKTKSRTSYYSTEDRMKASLKFREEQKKPLFRAKVPLSILGMPFQSGIVAGDSKEFTLNLATFFESGPSIKASYRPNDSQNPFSLVVRTGTGPFGSPLKSSMLMTCEFKFPSARTGGPLFMLYFKPRLGDFTFKKSQSSVFDGKGFAQPNALNGDVSIEVVQSPVFGSSFAGAKVPMLATDSPAAGALRGFFSGVEVAARTMLPVRGRAAVKFRWGLRVPAEIKGNAFQRIPFLVMDKIGIEHMAECADSKKAKDVAGGGSALGSPTGDDVAEACFSVKRQMEVLQAENGLLRNAVEDLRHEISGFRLGGLGSEYRELNGGKGKNPNVRRNEKKTASDFSNFPGKLAEAEASEELKKAFMGAAPNGA